METKKEWLRMIERYKNQVALIDEKIEKKIETVGYNYELHDDSISILYDMRNDLTYSIKKMISYVKCVWGDLNED